MIKDNVKRNDELFELFTLKFYYSESYMEIETCSNSHGNPYSHVPHLCAYSQKLTYTLAFTDSRLMSLMTPMSVVTWRTIPADFASIAELKGFSLT